MGSYDESKRKHGRPYDQLTHDGTGNVDSVGPGGTGDIDRALQQPERGGSQQSAGRTDDLLAGGPEGSAKGFRDTGDLQTGLGGTGSLSQGGKSAQAERAGSMQGERAASNEVPPGDARAPHKSDRGA